MPRDPVSRDTVLALARKIIDAQILPLSTKVEKLDSTLQTRLNAQDVVIGQNTTSLARIEEKGVAHDRRLENLEAKFEDEARKQAVFRHDVKGYIDQAQNEKALAGKINGSWVKWIKYFIFGPALVIAVEWIKERFLKGK